MSGGGAGAGAGAGSLWNKNSWHWEEKKYTPWAHAWLKEKLPGVRVEKGDAAVWITEVASVKGDAAVNIRKGKKLPMFEFTITCNWKGTQGDGTCTGTAQVFEVIPDDARDKDYDVQVRQTTSSCPTAYALMRREGANALKDVLATFVDALNAKDGDERALAADRARREEESRKAAEAEVTGAAGYAAASQEVEEEERKRTEEAAKRAADEPTDGPQKVEGTGSVWNQGSYHWEEKPLHGWARDRLKAMLLAWELEVPGCSMSISIVESCLGDASISIRKGKKLCFFELSAKCSWEGQMIDGDGNIIARTDGNLEFKEMDQDNYNDDLELELTCDAESSGERRIESLMRKHGLPSVRETLAAFVAELLTK